MTLDFADFTADDTRRINQIAAEIKEDYTDFIDDCCKKYDNYLFWATPFASRDVLVDNTYFELCKVLYAVEVAKSNPSASIITDTKAECDTIKSIIDGNVNASYRKKNTPRSFINEVVGRWKSIARFVLQKFLYVYHAPDFNYPTKTSIVIGPAISTDYSGENYNDRYTTGIEKYGDVIFLPYIIHNDKSDYKDLLEKVKKCKDHIFLYDKKICSLLDLVEIVKYILYVHWIKNGKFVFNEMDISPIVKQSLLSKRYDSTAYEGLWMRKSLQRLSKQKTNIDSFILWYEGRPADILSSSTIRKCFPKSSCIGYEGFALSESNIALYLSKYQFSSQNCPSTIAVPGRIFESDAHQFCKEVPLKYVPILRNEYSFVKGDRPKSENKRILLLLSYYRDISAQMICMLDEYVKKSSIECDITIKNHPTYENDTISDYGVTEVSFTPQYVVGNLRDYLSETDVVIASLTTSTIEMVCAKVPLIIIYPKGSLGYTALPQEIREKACKVVYDANELTNALDYCKDENAIDDSMISNLIVEKNADNMKQLFF